MNSVSSYISGDRERQGEKLGDYFRGVDRVRLQKNPRPPFPQNGRTRHSSDVSRGGLKRDCVLSPLRLSNRNGFTIFPRGKRAHPAAILLGVGSVMYLMQSFPRKGKRGNLPTELKYRMNIHGIGLLHLVNPRGCTFFLAVPSFILTPMQQLTVLNNFYCAEQDTV